jgi:hypothetical protein
MSNRKDVGWIQLPQCEAQVKQQYDGVNGARRPGVDGDQSRDGKNRGRRCVAEVDGRGEWELNQADHRRHAEEQKELQTRAEARIRFLRGEQETTAG